MQIASDGVLEAFAAKMAAESEWMTRIYDAHLPDLGGAVADVMQGLIEPNRYTGELQDSIVSEYKPYPWEEVSIRPTASRGDYDAGALLELGTGPIPNAPWAPIKAWADFRGIPAWPVWHAIREVGVKPHPFLQRTADDAGTAVAMEDAAQRIILDAALAITEALPVSSAGFMQP